MDKNIFFISFGIVAVGETARKRKKEKERK